MEHPFRYRNKAQFPIQKKDNMPVIGFYKKKSHDLISTDECIIQHEVNDKIIKIIKCIIIKNDIVTSTLPKFTKRKWMY